MEDFVLLFCCRRFRVGQARLHVYEAGANIRLTGTEFRAFKYDGRSRWRRKLTKDYVRVEASHGLNWVDPELSKVSEGYLPPPSIESGVGK